MSKVVVGLNKLLGRLKGMLSKAEADKGLNCIVGYESPIAVFVHENMNPKTLGQHVPRPSGKGFYWGPSSFGPKFLEAPAREMKDELGGIVRQAMTAGKTVRQALLMAGLRLQRESQKRVPYEHGDLHRSAFTEITS